MRAVWSFLLKFKFDYRNIFCPLNKMWYDRSKLYGLFFHLFCSEFVGIYPVYGSVRRICPTSFLKQIMYMMCGEAILCWIQWPKRGWADTPSSHIHTEHTYVSHTDSWNRPERGSGRVSLPLSPCVPICHGALCSSEVVEIGSWWADESWIALGGPRTGYYLDFPPCTITSLCFCVYRRAFVT